MTIVVMRFGVVALCLLPLWPQFAAGQVTSATAQISGKVRRADTGELIAGAVLTLRPATGPSNKTSTRTSANGSYSFEKLSGGDYYLVAFKNGFNPTIYGVTQPWRGITALRLPPGGRADKIDFDLTLTPELEQMEDDAFAATYPQQRVYLNFPFGRFSPDGTAFGIVVGDILINNPEQVWRYDLQSQNLVAVTEKPRPNTVPTISDIEWAGDTLYVFGQETAGVPREFLLAVTPTETKPASELPHAPETAFLQGAGSATVIGDHLVMYEQVCPRCEPDLIAHTKDGKPEFTIGQGGPKSYIFNSRRALIFYALDGWYGRIVKFDLNTRQSAELTLPVGESLALLDATRVQNAFLVAYAVNDSCVPRESATDYPWVLTNGNHRPMRICFLKFPDNTPTIKLAK